ncbi:MAG: HU family DNA-binding protein [Spirochaetales bacterium]|nr:HU family DNA-binding protein [Spirochaetales bacterium]
MNHRIERHLKALYEKGSFGELPFERVEESWQNKEELFSGQAGNLKLEEIETLAPEENRAFLALTFSGSLLAFYADEGKGDGCRLEYSSIKFREDVPDLIVESSISLTGEVTPGQSAEFESRMLKKTSPLYRIVAAPEELEPDKQNKRIAEGMIFLSNGFVKINKTYLTEGKGEGPDHFTRKTMLSYLSRKHEMTQKDVKSLLDDYEAMIESGVLMGERVPLGRLGKFYADVRPAQKARIGRNPATGEEMTISAKPAVYVPKISFSSSFKERVSKSPVPAEEE